MYRIKIYLLVAQKAKLYPSVLGSLGVLRVDGDRESEEFAVKQREDSEMVRGKLEGPGSEVFLETFTIIAEEGISL